MHDVRFNTNARWYWRTFFAEYSIRFRLHNLMRMSLNIKETVCMGFAALCSIFGVFITNICNNVQYVLTSTCTYMFVCLCACNKQSNPEPMFMKVFMYICKKMVDRFEFWLESTASSEHLTWTPTGAFLRASRVACSIFNWVQAVGSRLVGKNEYHSL